MYGAEQKAKVYAISYLSTRRQARAGAEFDEQIVDLNRAYRAHYNDGER